LPSARVNFADRPEYESSKLFWRPSKFPSNQQLNVDLYGLTVKTGRLTFFHLVHYLSAADMSMGCCQQQIQTLVYLWLTLNDVSAEMKPLVHIRNALS